MEGINLKGYFEFFSHLVNFRLNADLNDLLTSANDSQIHTFGWPIGVVLQKAEYLPKPYNHDGKKGIRFTFEAEDIFEFWTLDTNGDYYIRKSLFEDRREGGKIFFDTRTIRATEVLLRTARLYKSLNIPDATEVECLLKYGGLKGRILSSASSQRDLFFKRKCNEDEISILFRKPLDSFLDKNILKEMVFEVIKSITEMCDGMWVPSKKDVIDPIVENFLNGRIS